MIEENKNNPENSFKKSNGINIEDFRKVDIVVGKILSAEKVPDTDKLLKLSVDLGEEKERQIISGISLYFPDCSVLIGKKCMFVANLETRVIRGIESQGMILAVSTSDDKFSLLIPNDEIPVGARAK
ncbi:MAG: methionine--tRNA ligase subunit beta [Candidatus Paceibacterota bacterium]